MLRPAHAAVASRSQYTAPAADNAMRGQHRSLAMGIHLRAGARGCYERGGSPTDHGPGISRRATDRGHGAAVPVLERLTRLPLDVAPDVLRGVSTLLDRHGRDAR